LVVPKSGFIFPRPLFQPQNAELRDGFPCGDYLWFSSFRQLGVIFGASTFCWPHSVHYAPFISAVFFSTCKAPCYPRFPPPPPLFQCLLGRLVAFECSEPAPLARILSPVLLCVSISFVVFTARPLTSGALRPHLPLFFQFYREAFIGQLGRTVF